MIGEDGKLYIDGGWAKSSGDDWIEAVSPATEEVIGRVPAANRADIDRAVAAARHAFDHGPWPRMTHAERARIIQQAMDHLRAIADEVAITITSEMGSPISQSRAVQVPRSCAIWEYFAELATDYPWTEVRPSYDDFNAASEVVVEREPVGVVAAIVPWIQALIWAFKPTDKIDIRRFPEAERIAEHKELAELAAYAYGRKLPPVDEDRQPDEGVPKEQKDKKP